MHYIFALCALCLMLPVAGYAAGGAQGPGHGGTTAEQWRLMAFTIVNFTIFVLVIARLARAPLRDYLVGRRRALLEAMADAAHAKAEAERTKREYEAKAAALDQTRADLIKEIRSLAEADRERLLEEARESAERMRADAERTARSDLERARADLRAEAARLAEEIAREEMRRRLTDVDRSRLLEDFLDRVQQ